MLTATSPLRWDSRYAVASSAPEFGADTEWALTEVLGLSTAEIGRLTDQGTVLAATRPSAPSHRVA